MRHNHEQLHELLRSIYQPFQDGLTVACGQAAQDTGYRTLAPDRKQLFSAMVRAGFYDYLQANPIDGYTLDRKAHSNMQPVVLKEKSSGLEVRLIRLSSIKPHTSTLVIPHISQDPALTNFEGLFPVQSVDPGTMGIAWETPIFDKDRNPIGPIELTAIRTQPGTKLRDGKADFMTHLRGPERLAIPKSAFDPNDYDYDFTLEDQDNAE